MALLNLRKNKKVSTEATQKTKKLTVTDASKKSPVVTVTSGDFDSGVILRHRVTEKATVLSEKQGRTICVFEVSRDANKNSVIRAIQGLYKVTPDKVAVLRILPKKNFVRGRVSKGKTGYK